MNKDTTTKGSASEEAEDIPYSRGIPRPTWGPMAAALGVALCASGLVTNTWMLVGGAAITIVGLVCWFLEVFPGERLEALPSEFQSGSGVDYRADASATPVVQRAVYPKEIRPYRAGIVGGLIGGIAMAVVAMLWGIILHGSPWLPINLLSGVAIPSIGDADLETLRSFNGAWLATALLIHATLSIGIGLLFTTALPMMPDRPVLAGGILVPVIATGIVWASIGLVNPALEAHISWPWFIGSQVAFGIACGRFVASRARIPAMAGRSLADRLKIERGRHG